MLKDAGAIRVLGRFTLPRHCTHKLTLGAWPLCSFIDGSGCFDVYHPTFVPLFVASSIACSGPKSSRPNSVMGSLPADRQAYLGIWCVPGIAPRSLHLFFSDCASSLTSLLPWL